MPEQSVAKQVHEKLKFGGFPELLTEDEDRRCARVHGR